MPHNAREVREDRWVTAISSRLQWLSGRAVWCSWLAWHSRRPSGQLLRRTRYSGNCPAHCGANPADAGQPCLIQPITGSCVSIASALCWQSHQVPPRQDACSWRRQHRQIMFPLSPARRRPRYRARSGRVRVGAPHPPASLGRALVLVQAAPRAVLLRPADRVT